ncbi:hypothetical protein JYK02_34835 [Corallococcus macrosporus]|uniref:Lipoprotein n=1 Tax=Corallococcus macrosporus TaxID=35 RepID=A0ABS3DN11_9BACT|nr:hypothetical protein [Corallococcus macrosporus]MBN8232707.1 hypothetical protein [Corallococcus macrosporus]
MISLPVLAGWLLMAAPSDFSAPLRARGEKTAASSVEMTSDGQQLLLEVEVVDTTPSSSKDDVHSDHVELWFSLADLDAVGPTRFVTAGEGHLYRVDGGDSPRALDRSIRKEPEAAEDNGLDCTESERNARQGLGTPPARRVRAFFGLAHLGLFRDGRPAVLYDRPVHAAAGLTPALAPGDVSYSVRKTQRGYHVSAKIQPGGLVFVPRTGVETLRARVDVIDAGGRGAPEVLRSSHAAPQWGEPSTFDEVKLAQPLKVQLLAGVPELSQPELEALPRYFMRMGEEWRGVGTDRSTPRDSNRYCRSTVDEVEEYVFPQWTLGPATPFAGPDTVRVPVQQLKHEGGDEMGRQELVLLRGKPKLRSAMIDGVLKVAFRFEDGALGAVVENTSFMLGNVSGPCGAAVDTSLNLWRMGEAEGSEVELLSWGSCSDTLTHQGQTLFEPEQSGFSTDSYTWQKPGQTLRMKLTDESAVDLSWNPRDGSGVTARLVELQPPEEQP